jgi:translation initiation factor IF-1
MFDPPITTTGTVIDSPKEKIYRVALPNDKIVIGHVPKALAALHEQIKPGTKVRLELTPYDLSKARIAGLES